MPTSNQPSQTDPALLKTSREVRLRSRPDAAPTPENFSIESVDLPALQPGEAQVCNLFLSVDPYMRGRMRDQPSYVPPFEIGKALEGGAVGRVVQSRDERLRTGDVVVSMLGWREAFNAPADRLQKVDHCDRLGGRTGKVRLPAGDRGGPRHRLQANR